MGFQTIPERRAELLKLVMEVSLERREVTLASGRKSHFYLDLRQTMMRPLGVKLVGDLILDRLLGGLGVDAIGGMAVGAVPVVSAVLSSAAHWNQAEWLVGFFVRKEKKKHGLGLQIEGAFQEGQAVALLEDTTTTGGSTLDALDIVEAAGGRVARVICIVDRGEGAAAAFARRGVTLESLFDRADIDEALNREG